MSPIAPTRKRLPNAPPLPTTLKLIDPKLSTRCQSISVHHHSITGDLLLGCFDGAKIYSNSEGQVRDLVRIRVNVIKEHEGEVYISYQENNETKFAAYNMEASETELLFSIPMKQNTASYFSVSKRFIAILDRNEGNSIKLYPRILSRGKQQSGPSALLARFTSGNKKQNLVSKKLKEFSLPFNILFLSDGTLLVSGRGALKHRLCKYIVPEVAESELKLIWTQDELYMPSGLAEAENGLLYVSGCMRKTIYILSAQGTMRS